MKKLIIILLFITSLAYSQGGPSVDKIEFRGKITTAIRDGIDVPTGKTWLIHNVTTNKLELANDDDVWVTVGDGLQEGSNVLPSGITMAESVTNYIELAPANTNPSLGNQPYVRIVGGNQANAVFFVLRDNIAEISGLTIAEIDAASNVSLVTKEWILSKLTSQLVTEEITADSYLPIESSMGKIIEMNNNTASVAAEINEPIGVFTDGQAVTFVKSGPIPLRFVFPDWYTGDLLEINQTGKGQQIWYSSVARNGSNWKMLGAGTAYTVNTAIYQGGDASDPNNEGNNTIGWAAGTGSPGISTSPINGVTTGSHSIQIDHSGPDNTQMVWTHDISSSVQPNTSYTITYDLSMSVGADGNYRSNLRDDAGWVTEVVGTLYGSSIAGTTIQYVISGITDNSGTYLISHNMTSIADDADFYNIDNIVITEN